MEPILRVDMVSRVSTQVLARSRSGARLRLILSTVPLKGADATPAQFRSSLSVRSLLLARARGVFHPGDAP